MRVRAIQPSRPVQSAFLLGLCVASGSRSLLSPGLSSFCCLLSHLLFLENPLEVASGTNALFMWTLKPAKFLMGQEQRNRAVKG